MGVLPLPPFRARVFPGVCKDAPELRPYIKVEVGVPYMPMGGVVLLKVTLALGLEIALLLGATLLPGGVDTERCMRADTDAFAKLDTEAEAVVGIGAGAGEAFSS